jgi:fatty-acyl-CoA synthase
MPNRVIVPKDRIWFKSWPKLLPKTMEYPEIPMFEPPETAARRFPNKAAIVYYGREITYREFWDSILKFATYLNDIGIRKGDRVAMNLPNCPHFAIAYYGILRANAIAVSTDPMLNAEGLQVLLNDSGSKVLVTMAQSLDTVKGMKGVSLEKVIAGEYTDYVPAAPAIPAQPYMRQPFGMDRGIQSWQSIMDGRIDPPAIAVGPDDHALIMYTSGTTGDRKGALHTHWSMVVNTVRAASWNFHYPSSVHLSVLPFFHITGMHYGMTAPIYTGGTTIILSRWDREAALQAVEKYHCTNWTNISTMVVDMLTVPDIDQRDLSSFIGFGGGGAPLPKAVGERLAELGIKYAEGYGLTEAGSGTHSNPREKIKLQCLGIPSLNVDSKVVDPETLQELPIGKSGELLMRSSSMFKEFWNKPEATAKAFVEIGGEKWFRTGDLVYMDEDGYLFIVDRLKRLVNRAGLKVWPASLESEYYKHPAIQEACIIGTPDARVGEEVKVCIVLKPDCVGKVTAEEIKAWGKERFASYEYPRIVEFVQELPKSASGKIQWRLLQEKEFAARRSKARE